MTPTRQHDPSEIPALLRQAHGAYGNEIGARLAEAGYDDLPRNGPAVLGGVGNQGATAVETIRSLGVTRQAASQRIDTLVQRGYLERKTNPNDRRRMEIELTDQGRAAAGVVRDGVLAVDRAPEAASPRTSYPDFETARRAREHLHETRTGAGFRPEHTPAWDSGEW